MAQGPFELPEQGGVVRDPDGRNIVTVAGGSTVAIAAGVAGDTVIKATPGKLLNVLITTAGTGALNIFDNASGHTGTIIGTCPTTAAAGTTFAFNMPAANGITVQGAATNAAVTISFV